MINVLKTSIIPVWNREGMKISQITLPETVTPVVSRRGGFSESGLYYKGAGCIYRKHIVNEIKKDERQLKKTSRIYGQYEVNIPKLYGKFGIFTFNHQPSFSDFEGGCGPKENKLVDNFSKFERKCIAEICNVIDTGLEGHKIYVCKPRRISSNPSALLDLLEYVLTENWNTAWDKNLWDDIEQYGYVRDIADWFISENFTHKLGTVHCLLRTLFESDKYLYTSCLTQLFGCNCFDNIYIPYLAALIVKKFSPESVPDLDLENLTLDLYKQLMLTIFSGKACCHLEQEEQWAWIREAFKKNYLDYVLKLFKYEMDLTEKRNNEIKKLVRQ